MLSFPLGKKMYGDWGRTLIYPSGSKITEYPGDGKVTQFFNEQIFVIPKIQGRPFFDQIENKHLYPEGPEQYEVFDIKTQDQLLYTVGIFERWEDIEGTKDKYLVIKYPKTNETEKWRVSFESSDLFKGDTTFLFVENVDLRINNKIKNIIETPRESNLINIGYDLTKEVLKKGDVVIFIPVFDPPELAKKDDLDNYLARNVIVRRIGGKI